ncbi:hypothetical protein KKH30_03435 [Candidatus Micrarchaeota archaeon]|nr:hypothetical protein [Candidatus Micrarchaeota archaeon]MBU1939790.1 hypothetical protein [Candidatus Micrarchaeota archaeon]
MNYFIYFLSAFLLTNALEFMPLHLLVKAELKRKIVLLLIINAITLPVLWALLPLFYSHYLPAFIALEVLVFVAESFLLMKLFRIPPALAVKASFAMNLLSAAAGFFFL